MVVAQLVRASDCGSEGRGFESRLPPFFKSLEFAIVPVFFSDFAQFESLRQTLSELPTSIRESLGHKVLFKQLLLSSPSIRAEKSIFGDAVVEASDVSGKWCRGFVVEPVMAEEDWWSVFGIGAGGLMD